jgi:DNA invertase Pin-like site-specific DNA recombinase
MTTSIGQRANVKKPLDPDDSVRPAQSRAVAVLGSPPAPNEARAVIGYTTVSSDESSVANDAVETICSACNRLGWRLVKVVRDRHQGLNALKRPGLSYAVGQLTAGNADALVVTDVDCLGRSMADLGQVMQWFCDSQARLVVLDIELDTATVAGGRFAALLARLSERERDRVARRTGSGLAELRTEGRSLGRSAVPDRPDLRNRIGEMRRAGMTLRAIADRLDDEGVPTLRRETRWRPSSVQATLGYRRPGRRSAGEVDGTTVESSVRSAFRAGEL